MNQARGEAAVMLGGVRRRVCLTLGALAEIETGLGVEGLAAAAPHAKAPAAAVPVTAYHAGGPPHAALSHHAAGPAHTARAAAPTKVQLTWPWTTR